MGGNIAKCFMQQGAKVVAVDIRQEQLDKRVEELKTYGEDVIGIVGNVLDIASLEKLWIVPRWLSKVKAASPTSPNTHATYPYPNISKKWKNTSYQATGNVNQKQAPLPDSLSTPIVPPSCSTMLLLIDNPNPVPCTKEFSLTKRSNISSLLFLYNADASISNIKAQQVGFCLPIT